MKHIPQLLKKLLSMFSSLLGKRILDDQLDYRTINISTR